MVTNIAKVVKIALKVAGVILVICLFGGFYSEFSRILAVLLLIGIALFATFVFSAGV